MNLPARFSGFERWVRRVRIFFATQMGTWLLSILAAVIVWAVVREKTSNTQVMEAVPLAVHVPDGWMVVSQSSRQVNLMVKGTKSELAGLRRDAVQVTVNLKNRPIANDAAMVSVTLGSDYVSLPRGVRLESISTNQVTIQMERIQTALVPVRLVTQNMLPTGYETVSVSISPSAIEVTGPKSSVQGLSSVATEPLNLDGRVDSVHQTRFPLAAPPTLAMLSYGVETVQLDVEIAARRSARTFRALPVRLLIPGGLPVQAELEPEVCDVTVSGSDAVIAGLTADDIRLFVEPVSFIPSETPATRVVQAKLPAGVTVHAITPSDLSVRMVRPDTPAEAGRYGGER